MATAIIAIILIAAVILGIRSYRKKVASGCCGSGEGDVKKIKVHDKDESHYQYEAELEVEGMHCGNCAKRVENAINSHEGLWGTVDLEKHTLLVRAKKAISEPELRAYVKEAGYFVTGYRQKN